MISDDENGVHELISFQQSGDAGEEFKNDFSTSQG